MTTGDVVYSLRFSLIKILPEPGFDLGSTAGESCVLTARLHIHGCIDKRIVCFIHNSLNHSKKVCRLLLLAKLHSISSTFATNYRHLFHKYELVQTDWHSGLAHLLGKVKMKYQNKNAQNCPANMSIIRELCDIRDGRHIACNIICKTEVCSLLT